MLDDNIREKLKEACGSSRVVFWEDASGEFTDDVAGLDIPGVEVVDVRGRELATKRRVLRTELDRRFLLYRGGGTPDLAEDFLLDVKLLARPFSATQSASWTEECGLPLEAGDVVRAHAAFFGSAERRRALRELVDNADWMSGGYTPDGLVLSMIAACCGSRARHRVDAVRDMASGALEEFSKGTGTLARLLDRCDLVDDFWCVMRSDMGYESEEPGFEDFALEVMLSACSDLTGQPPTLTEDAALVVSSLANDSRRRETFRNLVDSTGDYVASRCDLDALPLETLAAHRYLPVVDSVILERLAADVAQGVDCTGRIRELRSRRASAVFFDGWASGYDALAGASGVLAGTPAFEREVGTVDSPKGLFDSYARTWSGIDAAYRAFWTAYPAASQLMPDLLPGIGEKAEVQYARYVDRLAATWQELVIASGKWPFDVADVSQRTFFDAKVRPALVTGRVAVVISDALRYEAGAEWAREARDRGTADVKCDAMLASLPSYTQLGMASLLPGEALSIDPKGLGATVDGLDATGGRNREAILRRAVPDATALSCDSLLGPEGDERLRGASLAYVYQNVVDATGDKLVSEERTFNAVGEAFAQLDRACARLLSLGFATVIVTADHGFLYQQDDNSLEYADVPFLPTVLDVEGSKCSRRFVAAGELPDSEALIEMDASRLGLEGDFEVGLPRGTRRLRLRGSGARFVHGGMTLQETVVPCVTVRRTASGKAGREVAVDLLTGAKVITGSLVHFDLYQEEPVGDGVLPASLRVGLYDADGTLRSESRPVEMASASANAEERRVPVELTVAREAANGARLTLRVERRYGATSKYKTIAEATYVVRRNFGMDF